MKNEYNVDSLLTSTSKKMNADFIKKVYSLLSCQLLLTFTFASFAAYQSNIHEFVLERSEINIAAYFMNIVFFITLYCFQNKYPINIILLFLFTMSISYNIGYIAALFQENNNASILITALAITIIDFSALTIYVMFTKKDFHFLQTGLLIALFSLILFSSFTFIFPTIFKISNSIIGFIGTVVFSGYILYDTSELLHRMGPDDYIIATIQLYLDIINLFMYLLQFLSTRTD
tara:strand:- start:1739 stop:2434 length:696 start_codon:yes stop_codon:yes gene_type:complete